jgi:hypothetical protein
MKNKNLFKFRLPRVTFQQQCKPFSALKCDSLIEEHIATIIFTTISIVNFCFFKLFSRERAEILDFYKPKF